MSGLKDALMGMRESAEAPVQERSLRPSVAPPVIPPAARPKGGKSSDPDFEAVKIFVRKGSHKLARRKWEDAEGGDFSDLVQQLLDEYLGA